MRHLRAHRKLGRTTEHRMSMLRNLATSLINARDERIITTVPKAKELRPFVERVITLAKRAGSLEGDSAAAQSLHLRRQAAGFFHAGNTQQAASTGKRGQPRAPRTAGVAALKRLFDELGKRYADRPGGYTRIIRLGRRDGDNAELAIIELVGNPRELEGADSKKAKSATSGRKKTVKSAGVKAEPTGAETTKKEGGGGSRSKKKESTAAEKDTE
ncbi:MAG TPA: 50S ribosomal protein L17 [Pyrinomonadaceae bacterium]|nr:50S ribosomal protein L17 [Pyrinomonadaceae bacterium]